MRSMRSLVLLLVLSTSVSGCAGIRTWLQEIQQNPVAGILDAIGAIGTAVDMSRAVFNVLADASPEVATQRAEFDRYVADVMAGVDAGRATLNLVTDIRTANVGRIMSGAFTALERLYAFIASIRTHVSAERLAGAVPARAAGTASMTVSEFHTRGLDVIRHALPSSRQSALSAPAAQ